MLFPPTPLQLSLPLVDLEAICPKCAEPGNRGLCHLDHCRREVLPREPRSPLIRLMGEALVEQKRLQKAEDPQASVAIEKVKRRNARKVARSSRKGYFGLALAIMNSKPHP